tara:strand:- start:66 stop:1067 length:1002 start_codon:yes stop_codon:yes gene_type:complete
MNKEYFEERKAKVPNFVKNYVFSLDLDKIEFDDWNTQIRQKGHINPSRLAQSIIGEGQQVPISVKELANGKWELKDGATRFLALKKLGETKVLASNYFDQVENKSDDAEKWYDYQCVQNDHPVNTPNSKEDVQHQIQIRMEKGWFNRLVGKKYQEDQEGYLEKCVSHLKTVYKNSGLKTNTLKSMLKKVLGGAISVSYQSYNVDTAMEFVKSNNKLKWKGKGTSKGVGVIDNNVVFYVPASKTNFITNTCGNALAKKTSNKNVEIYVVYYVGDLAGKNDKAILKEREEIEDAFKERSIWVDDKGNGIFAGLYFLPQIKSGKNGEKLHELIRAV